MQRESRPSKGSLYVLRSLVVLLIIVTIYALNILGDTARIYEDTSKTLSAQSVTAKTVQLGDATVTIPTYDLFKTGNVWALVSKDRPLRGEAGYTLVDIPVAHGDEGLPMKIARDISDELERLVNAAEADGEPLMISSAYRSLKEQKTLHDEFVEENGAALAAQYVLPVGASEHHTGLTVDFSSVSDECAEDSDSCSLSQSAAAWLEENAPRFGFILRYPDGAQSITGVRYEPWHYRFVGVPLARAIATTDLTYEEVIEQIAPGYAKTR